jgi:hypothetical protein
VGKPFAIAVALILLLTAGAMLLINRVTAPTGPSPARAVPRVEAPVEAAVPLPSVPDAPALPVTQAPATQEPAPAQGPVPVAQPEQPEEYEGRQKRPPGNRPGFPGQAEQRVRRLQEQSGTVPSRVDEEQ